MSEREWQPKSTLPLDRHVELRGIGWEGHGTVHTPGNIRFDDIVATARHVVIGGPELITGWRECLREHDSIAA